MKDVQEVQETKAIKEIKETKKMNAIKGNIINPISVNELGYYSYMVIEDGLVVGVYNELPQEYAHLDVEDYGDKLIMPGFVDTHLHGPQYVNMGIGLDDELLPWLEKYTFPEEKNFKDKDYAKYIYTHLVNDLVSKGTTSSVLFGSIYTDTNLMLVDILREKGLRALVGKVNMDRNSPDFYVETTETSLEETQRFIEETLKGDTMGLVRPIITPRFVPTCTAKLMQSLGDLAEKYDLKVQSHLSENKGEIEWVASLHPECASYFDVYKEYGLIREGGLNTVMAHCVWSDEKEQLLMKEHGVMVAHAPFSNGDLASGIAPIGQMMDRDVVVGLASDISGGHELYMGRVIAQSAIVSKCRYAYTGDRRLTTTNLLYMATKGGGQFLGKVGCFDAGYEADYIVIDDRDLLERDLHERTLEERLQRFFYKGWEKNIVEVYVHGRRVK